MRVSTLVATVDRAYTGHISEYISEYHADTVEISVCNSAEQLQKMLGTKRYNVALVDKELICDANLYAIDLPLLLWADSTAESAQTSTGVELPTVKRIKKHRRISTTVADILEQFAALSGNAYIPGEPEGSITAVWSPSGGVGKTTVALAYAASLAQNEKEVFYLNLEAFAATSAYLPKQGKSISAVFEMLGTGGGNAGMLIQGIQSCDSGICYLCAPDNFDDICILAPENIRELVTCCAGITGELVIDLSCVCDSHTRQVFELADKVLLVTDTTDTAKAKLGQFMSQSNVYESIKDKLITVVNKNKMLTETAGNAASETVVNLPYVQEGDERYIYLTLAKSGFGR